MKLTFLFIVVSFFQLQAFTFYGQNAKVSFNMDDASLEMVIKSIEGQTDYKFFYNIEDIDTRRPFTLKVDKRPLRAVLKTLFKNSSIDYVVVDKQIVLTIKKEETSIRVPTETIQHLVKGTVTDSNGVPITGATVTIKGTSTGTFTNEEGVFFVNVSPPDVLVLTYIGFKPLEVLVGNSDELSIVLQEDVTNLDAVTVNAGYYTVKERERTGSITKVTSEEIELQPIVSPLEALQGRMAGVEVVQQNGLPGNAPTIRIRGRNSLRVDGNYPLYIIDGLPIDSSPIEGGSNLYTSGLTPGFDPLSTLDLFNIESIEVLKDADATAIYGSRGANGVILITTKNSNFNQKTNIEVKAYSGLGKVSNKVDLINTQQYLLLRQTALKNDNRLPNATSDYDLLLWDQNRYTDWQKTLYGKTSPIKGLNIFISGGNKNSSFRLGTSYHNEGSVFPGEYGYHKSTTSLNLIHYSENKKLKVNLTLNYGVDQNDIFANGGTNLYNTALSLPPNAPKLYNDDGSLHWKNWEYSSWNNPLAILLHRTTTDNGKSIIANIGLSYQLFKGGYIKTNFGYTNLDREFIGNYSKDQYKPEVSKNGQHESVKSQRNRSSWILEPQFNYNTKLGKGQIDGLIGVTFQKSKNKNLMVTGTGFVSEDLMGDLSAANSIKVNNNHVSTYKYNALFARLGYNWDHKYFINFTGRRDGSSRFGPNKRFANFWAIGGAWIFTEESLIKKNMPFLNFGKIRLSYGTTGNDLINDYGYINSYEPTKGPNGIYPTKLTNPNYSWEVNKKLETALELGFWEDKININVARYQNRSSNQLIGYNLPSVTGFSSVMANLPATVQNKGWEVELSTTNLNLKKFKWRTTFNISFPKNELLEYPDIEQSTYANIFKVGYPLNIQFLYHSDGINTETGTYQFIDVNKDGNYDINDQTFIKPIGRKYFGGLSNTLSYSGLDLKFLFEFVKQDARNTSTGLPGSKTIQTTDYFDKWDFGSNKELQKVSESTDILISYYNSLLSDLIITDASYVILKSLSLTYRLPQSALQKTNIHSCRIFLQGQNLLTFSNYSGLNVQFPGGNSIPSLRSITLGVQIKI